MEKITLTIITLIILVGPACVQAQYDIYTWQALRADKVDARAATAVVELRRQVQEVLDAGNHLGASFQYYADVPTDGFYQYEQPGRIITMLAWAYPYLAKNQQEAVKTYIATEVGDANYAPWSSSNYLPVTNVGKRQRYTMTQVWNWDRYWGMMGQNTDNLNGALLYGLWLYARTSGDWGMVSSNWSAIASAYTNRSSGGNLYGTYGMHIGLARMAQHQNDAARRTTALNAINTRLSEGLSFATVDAADSTYFSPWANSRKSWGYHFGGMFLYLSNEIGRYLRDENTALHSTIVARQNAGKSKFTNWWLYRLPVFCRWSGDEGIGAPSEIIGMMFPVERWVANPSADSLLALTIWNTQNSIGDCHVVEAAAQTIDACGREKWRDVRNASFVGPGIIVLSAGATISERLLIDNPQSQALSVSYPVKPSFITGANSGDITGIAPPTSQVDSLTTILSTGGTAVDTMHVTVVVLGENSVPVRHGYQPSTRQFGSLSILDARVQVNILLIKFNGNKDEKVTVTMIDLAGRIIVKKSTAGITSQTISLDHDCSAGVFQVMVTSGAGSDIKRIIVR